MSGERSWRAGALVAIGLVAGTLVAPPIVNAASTAATNVKIEDNNSTTKANVTSNNKLSVDTEAAVTDLGDNFLNTYGYALTIPYGEYVLLSDFEGCSEVVSGEGIITAVNINQLHASGSDVSVIIIDEQTNIIWNATYPAGEYGSINFSFENGLYVANGFSTQGGDVNTRCQVYGEGFVGASPGRPENLTRP